jgi:hypothetical protein
MANDSVVALEMWLKTSSEGVAESTNRRWCRRWCQPKLIECGDKSGVKPRLFTRWRLNNHKERRRRQNTSRSQRRHGEHQTCVRPTRQVSILGGLTVVMTLPAPSIGPKCPRHLRGWLLSVPLQRHAKTCSLSEDNETTEVKHT